MNAARSDRSDRADDSDGPDDRRAQGRASYAAGAWTDAHQALTEADREAPLDVPDLERAGTAATLIGRQTEAIELWGRAHHAALETGDLPAAVRHAFWIGMTLLCLAESSNRHLGYSATLASGESHQRARYRTCLRHRAVVH